MVFPQNQCQMPCHSRKKQGKEFDNVSLKVKNAKLFQGTGSLLPKANIPSSIDEAQIQQSAE